MTEQQPKIPAAQIIHVLIQGMPKNPGERMMWEGMTREDVARRLSQAKAGSHKAATVRSKIRKMARAGNLEVCGCGEHVRPTQRRTGSVNSHPSVTRSLRRWSDGERTSDASRTIGGSATSRTELHTSRQGAGAKWTSSPVGAGSGHLHQARRNHLGL